MDDGLIKDIQIEDWLRREPVQVDMRKITAHIEGRRVMVTGAAGAVGREIVRQLATLNPYQLILVDQAESPLYDVQLELSDHWKNLEVRVLVADVANRTRMEVIFEETRPQLIFHSAAYKHVQLMDDFVSEAIQTNISGTVNIADLAAKYRVSRMVMISAANARHPENAMEYSKRVAEIYVQSSDCRLKRDTRETDMFIVRLGEVYPTNTHCLITLSEACMLTLEVGVMGDGGEVYIVGGPGDGLLDSVIGEKIKREKASVDDYEHVREEVLALVQHSYTEKKAILIGLMKKIVPIFPLSSTR